MSIKPKLVSAIIQVFDPAQRRLFAKDDACGWSNQPRCRGTLLSDVYKLIEDLKRARDEVKLHIHLGPTDARAEWAGLEKRWHALSSKAALHKTGGELSGTAKKLGSELKHAYVRLRKAL
jgi:hypothetical protein